MGFPVLRARDNPLAGLAGGFFEGFTPAYQNRMQEEKRSKGWNSALDLLNKSQNGEENPLEIYRALSALDPSDRKDFLGLYEAQSKQKEQQLKQQREFEESQAKLQKEDATARNLWALSGNDPNMFPGGLKPSEVLNYARLQAQQGRTSTTQPLTPEMQQAVSGVVNDPLYQKMSPEQAGIAFNNAGVPPRIAEPYINAKVQSPAPTQSIREQELAKQQVAQDIDYNKKILGKEKNLLDELELYRDLDRLNEEDVTGGALDRILEKAGLVQFTSEGRREFTARGKDVFKNSKELFGSVVSDFQSQLLEKANPSPDFSKEANRAIIRNKKLAIKAALREPQIAQQIIDENDGVIPENFERKVRQRLNAELLPLAEEIARNNEIIAPEYNKLVAKGKQEGEPVNLKKATSFKPNPKAIEDKKAVEQSNQPADLRDFLSQRTQQPQQEQPGLFGNILNRLTNVPEDPFAFDDDQGAFARGFGSQTLGQFGDLYNLGRDLSHAPVNALADFMGWEKPPEGLRVPGSPEVKQGIDYLTNNALVPQTRRQEKAETFGEFLSPSVFEKGKKMLTAGRNLAEAGAAAAYNWAEDNDYGMLAKIFAAVAGRKGPGYAAKGAKKAANIIKDPADLLISFARLKPAQLNKEAVKIADQLGLPATAGMALGDDKLRTGALKWLEQRFMNSPLTSGDYKILISKMKNGLFEKYQDMMKKMSPTSFQGSNEAGRAGTQTITDVMNKHREAISPLREEALKLWGKDTKVPITNLRKSIDGLLSNLKRSPKPSDDQKEIINYFEDLKRKLGNSKELTVDQLTSQIASLNDQVDFKVPYGYQKLARNVVAEAKRDLHDFGVTPKGKAGYEKWKQYNKEFSEHADIFRNDLVKSMYNMEKPEAILAAMSNTEGLSKVERALSVSPEGKQMFESLKRFKAEEYFNKIFKETPLGETNLGWKRLLDAATDRESKQYLAKLLGPEGFRNLERMAKYGEFMQNALQKYANPSKTADVGIPVAFLSTLGASIISGNWPAVALHLGGAGAAKVLSNALSDPDLAKKIERYSKVPGASKEAKQLLDEIMRRTAIIYSDSTGGSNE